MVKALIMFVFGNALWDKLVEFFGSTDAVIFAAIKILVAGFIIYYFRAILITIGVILVLLIMFAYAY